MRLMLKRGAVVAGAVILVSPLSTHAAVMTTTLDPSKLTSYRFTDPGGTNSAVSDYVTGVTAGSGSVVPIGQDVTIDVALPAGLGIRVVPGVRYNLSLVFGATDSVNGTVSFISSFTGSANVNTGGGVATSSLSLAEYSTLAGQSRSLVMTSPFFPAAAPANQAVLINSFSFTFNIRAGSVRNTPAVLTNEFQLNVRAFKSVPNADVATISPLISVVPEPGVLISGPLLLGWAALRRCRRPRPGRPTCGHADDA